jgi:hypothetical protein
LFREVAVAAGVSPALSIASAVETAATTVLIDLDFSRTRQANLSV